MAWLASFLVTMGQAVFRSYTDVSYQRLDTSNQKELTSRKNDQPILYLQKELNVEFHNVLLMRGDTNGKNRSQTKWEKKT